MEGHETEDSQYYSILESKAELKKAMSTADVLKTYGMVDLSNVAEVDLCGWQEECGKKAAETKGGEQVAIEFFKMANDTRNRQRTGIETDELTRVITATGSRLLGESQKNT